MMFCQTPVGMVCEPCAEHGARLLELAQTVTVVICAVAFELCAKAMLEQQSRAAAVRLVSSFFMRVSNLDVCARSEVAGKESKPDPLLRTDHQGCGAAHTGWTCSAGPVGRNWNV